ncbi:MAG: protein kinase domain-containing protein [Anaerolineales bacterium]
MLNRFGFGRRSDRFPKVNTRFADRYDLLEHLGSGGDSMVFSARDTRLDRKVALKILSPDSIDKHNIERFRREALSVARLTHPGIVTIYDFDEHDGTPYLVLELADGTDLWRLVYEQQAELSLQDALHICMNILEALDYAHENGVAHRDLKPENVIVADDAYHTKVTDFGLAHIRGQARITQDGFVVGSAYYIAPEVANGAASDYRVDLYALGVILYELVAGRLPFYSENPLAVIAQHANQPPPPPTNYAPDIPVALEHIILRLLAKSPAERYSSAREVHAALAGILANAPTDTQDSPQSLQDRISHLPLMGRDAEWARLSECWAQVQMGAIEAHPVVMLGGEAGSGKSQLVQRLVTEARHSGALALVGQAGQQAEALPYQPIIEMLRMFLRAAAPEISPAAAADLAKLVPEIAEEYTLDRLPALSPEAERLRLFEHITGVLLHNTYSQPLLLVVEDLHIADPSSVSLLNYLVRHLDGAPVMLVGTYRPLELDHRHPLDATLQEWISRGLAERIIVRRLDRKDVAAMVARVFSGGVDDALTDVLYDKAQGNFFFTRELLKSLVVDGHVAWDDAGQRWRVSNLENVALPSSIRSIIGNKLTTLGPTARSMLNLAALLGTEFRLGDLVRVVDADEDAQDAALDELIDARLIAEKADPRGERYVFKNQAIRQTVIESLPHRQKSRLHLRLAKALEVRHAQDPKGYIETIARHYSLGARTDEDIRKAIDYLAEAAQRASDVFALRNALELYNIALDLSQDDVSAGRAERITDLRERRGLVYVQMGDFAAAAQDLNAVLETPHILNDPAHRRVILQNLGQAYRRAEQFDDATRILTAAVDLTRDMGDDALVADALYFLGATYWTAGDIQQALIHQEEAYAIVQNLGTEDAVAMRVYHGLAECYQRSVDYPRMYDFAERSLRIARELGDLEYQAENLTILATAENDRGDYERAQAIHEDNIRNCRAAGLRFHLTAALAGYGLAQAASGDYQNGIATLHEALDVATQHFKGFLQTMIWDYLGRCYLDLEMVDKAEAALSTAFDRAQRHQVSWADAYNKANWSMLQIRKGNLNVGPLLGETLARAQRYSDIASVPLLYRALAELAYAQNDPAALDWANRMRELAGEIDQPLQVIQAHRWRALAHLAQGDAETAKTILDDAIAASVTIKSPRLMWNLYSALANVQDALGDAVGAADSRRRVRETIEGLMHNIQDPAAKLALGNYLPSYADVKPQESTLRLLVITDTFGTMVENALRDHLDEIMRCDALILLGDVPSRAYPALRETFKLPLPGFCVLGNHDSLAWTNWLPRYKFEHLHNRLGGIRLGDRELMLGGFSGSERYKPQGDLQWEDDEAARAIKALPECDILLAHTAPLPPPGYPEDHRHRGLPALQAYIEKHKPRLMLHGHFHQNYRVQLGQTQIVGCYGVVQVSCTIDADDVWHITAEPLNKDLFGE